MFASWLRSADVTRVPEVAGEAKAIAIVSTNKQTGININKWGKIPRKYTIKGSYKEDSLKLTNLGCYCYELRCVCGSVRARTPVA